MLIPTENEGETIPLADALEQMDTSLEDFEAQLSHLIASHKLGPNTDAYQIREHIRASLTSSAFVAQDVIERAKG